MYVEDEENGSKDKEVLQASAVPPEAEEPKSAERTEHSDSALPSRRDQKTPEAVVSNNVENQTFAEETKERDGTIDVVAEKDQKNNVNTSQAHSGASKPQQVSRTNRCAVVTKL